MRRMGGVLLWLACVVLLASPASAQGAYPNRPIRVLIPYAPGGLTDVVARYYGDYIRKTMGQNALVENKPGASGIIAIEEMARAGPDGYTIMVGNISTNCLTPVLLAKRMHIDYDKDVQIIARLADKPVFFTATTKNFSPKTFAEFVDYAKGASRRGALRQLFEPRRPALALPRFWSAAPRLFWVVAQSSGPRSRVHSLVDEPRNRRRTVRARQFYVAPFWATMPKEVSPICDVVFTRALRERGA